MAANFPGPQVLRLRYSVDYSSAGGKLFHTLQYNVKIDGPFDPGDPFSGLMLTSRLGTLDAADDVVEIWLALIDHAFKAADTEFMGAELWDVDPGTFDYSWISTYTPVYTLTGVSTAQPASQAVLSFRTQEGGIMFLHFLDGVAGNTFPLSYGDLSGDWQAIADWVVAPATSFWLGRDTSYPVAFHLANNGKNEEVFRRRYRP